MNSIYRQMWQHGAVLVLGINLAGCGSNSANNTAQSVPVANAATSAPGAAVAHGAAAMPGAMNPGAVPAQPGTNPGTPSPEQMAQMMKPQPMPGAAQPGANPGSPTPEQMAQMMKQQQQSMPGAAQPGANPGSPTPEQMAQMMKQQQAMQSGAQAGANPGASSPDQMAKMKQQQQAMQGAGQAGGASAPNAQANANGAGAANSGQAAGSGRPAASGGAAAPSFPPGSADEAIYNFCVAMSEGDTSAASDYVSAKAKGVLAEMREGTLSEEKIEEITNLLKPLSDWTPNSEQTSSTKRSLRNGKDQSMSFTLKKEKDVYKITEFSYPKSKKKQ